MAWRRHRRFLLVFVGNRDEFYARPTAAADWWSGPGADGPRMLAGRDLQAGGTWLGLTEDGRFATVTNVREPGARTTGERSRGALVTALLQAPAPTAPEKALREIAREGARYAHFNLLHGHLANPATLAWTNNVDGRAEALAAGYHALSNHRLNTPWPKAVRLRNAVQSVVEGSPDDDADALVEALLGAARDRTAASDHTLPATGLTLSRERALSSPFIHADGYGTRATTVILADHHGGVRFVEQSFDGQGDPRGRVDQFITLASVR